MKLTYIFVDGECKGAAFKCDAEGKLLSNYGPNIRHELENPMGMRRVIIDNKHYWSSISDDDLNNVPKYYAYRHPQGLHLLTVTKEQWDNSRVKGGWSCRAPENTEFDFYSKKEDDQKLLEEGAICIGSFRGKVHNVTEKI